MRQLFDPHNKIFNALKCSPSLIIGRRGSGKTSYLHSVLLDGDYGIIEEIKTSKTFSQIVDAIEKTLPASFLSESVSDVWEELFYFALISEVAKNFSDHHREFRLLSDYLAKNELAGAASIDSFLWKVLSSLREVSGSDLLGAVANVVKEVTGIGFDKAKELAIGILIQNKKKAILLVDSLEHYPTSIESVAQATSGLLKCVGQFNERNDQLNIRLCLPAELYHVFLGVSSNPLKDFSNSLTLHWVAGELLSIAAHRLRLYLKLYFPAAHSKSSAYNLTLRDEVQQFLRSYFPSQVTNRFGVQEDVVAYILRHTQLQPRHVLMYCNAIFEQERKQASGTYPKISESSVRNGIATIEHRLCDETFSGGSLWVSGC